MAGRTAGFERWHNGVTTLIAAAAIALATWEGLENRAHNRLSVAPRVDVKMGITRTNDAEAATIEFSSSGLGPAVVGEFAVVLDGRLIYRATAAGGAPWAEVFATFADQGLRLNAQAFGAGMALRPGEDYRVFEAVRSPPDGRLAVLSTVLDRVGVAVCYCSIYGDRCGYALAGRGPAESEVCRT